MSNKTASGVYATYGVHTTRLDSTDLDGHARPVDRRDVKLEPTHEYHAVEDCSNLIRPVFATQAIQLSPALLIQPLVISPRSELIPERLWVVIRSVAF